MAKTDLSGRVAVITGAARGIGLAVAELAASRGAGIAIWDMDEAAAKAAAASLGQAARVSTHILDLTDAAAVEAATQATLSAHGRIDILVNNAGITGGNAPVWELPVAEWRRVIEVNLIAPFIVSRAVVPHMRAAGYGRVVNIASIAGKEGNPNASHYSASKAGLAGLRNLFLFHRCGVRHIGRARDLLMTADCQPRAGAAIFAKPLRERNET